MPDHSVQLLAEEKWPGARPKSVLDQLFSHASSCPGNVTVLVTVLVKAALSSPCKYLYQQHGRQRINFQKCFEK